MRYFILLLIGLLILPGCSEHSRAKRLARQGYAKIRRATALDPSVIDSVKGVKKIDISVPGEAGSAKISPEIDTSKFILILNRYDSLKKLLDDKNSSEGITFSGTGLIISPSAGDIYLQNGKTIQKDAIKKELKKTENRLMKGFYKDSIYHKEDSLFILDVFIKNGVLDSIGYKIKDRIVSKNVSTSDIKIDGCPPIWKQEAGWVVFGLIFVLLLVILVMARR